MTLCNQTMFINEGLERHEWDVADRKGRRLGTTVTFGTFTFEKVPEGTFSGYTMEPGTYYAWMPQATRAGNWFGASQGWRFCKTEAQRFHAVAKYLRGAQERAQKQQGR